MDKLKELSIEERELLLNVMLKQNYAKELLSSEIADIENHPSADDEKKLRQLYQLYDRLSKLGL